MSNILNYFSFYSKNETDTDKDDSTKQKARQYELNLAGANQVLGFDLPKINFKLDAEGRF